MVTKPTEETMAPTTENIPSTELSQADFHDLLRAKLRDAVRMTLMTVLQEEVDATVGARPYQRSAGRRDYRNGS